MSETKYLVRQYRPNYFSGFTNGVIRDVAYEDITKVPWCENFKGPGFERFTIDSYGGELIISAKYTDGTSWVVGFAVEHGSALADGWRYKEHEEACE